MPASENETSAEKRQDNGGAHVPDAQPLTLIQRRVIVFFGLLFGVSAAAALFIAALMYGPQWLAITFWGGVFLFLLWGAAGSFAKLWHSRKAARSAIQRAEGDA